MPEVRGHAVSVARVSAALQTIREIGDADAGALDLAIDLAFPGSAAPSKAKAGDGSGCACISMACSGR